jgi:HNH endonuclease
MSRHPTVSCTATKATIPRITSTVGFDPRTCSTFRSSTSWARGRTGTGRSIPLYVERDEPDELRVLLTFGKMRGPYDEREPVHIPDEIKRRYVVREVKLRIHQAQFRGAVLPAYQDRCAICRLREVWLLDAAHIVGDADEAGAPVISNGLSLCSIHHRAFDQDLVGVASNLRVHVSRRLLDDEDGPMLDVLKGFHGTTIEAPRKRVRRPDSDRLATRFERFLTAGWRSAGVRAEGGGDEVGFAVRIRRPVVPIANGEVTLQREVGAGKLGVGA